MENKIKVYEKHKEIVIKGAGIAGLTSAIILAKQDYKVKVFEKRSDVGLHRYGNFQGLENWTDDEDVLDYLKRLGIAADFWFKPVNKVTFFSHDNRIFNCEAGKPLVYMIKRGSKPKYLDYALKRQALNMGVKIIYNKSISFPVRIDSSGAKRAAAFAYGIVFDTDIDDIVSAIVDDRLAPKGYAYFIALNGKATLATAFFAKPFKDPKKYYLETLNRYQKLLDFKVGNPQEFAKYISFSLAKQRGGVRVGEAAGIQDYLFGFGMRLAIKSAELAALSIMEDKDYGRLYRAHILPFLRAGLVNRFLYERLGNNGYKRQLKKANAALDVRKFLGRNYRFSPVHRLFYPIARLKYRGLWD